MPDSETTRALHRIDLRLAALEAQVALLTHAPAPAKVPRSVQRLASQAAPQTLPDRVYTACSTPRTTSELTTLLGATAPAAIAELHEQGRLVQVGTEQHPRWLLRPGETAPVAELAQAIFELTQIAPRTLMELIDLTGAPRNRVHGARVQLEREGVEWMNLGTKRIARWWLSPEAAAKRAKRAGARS